MCAASAPDVRFRFSTSHPKDITDDILFAMLAHPNICKYIHLPAQSGNSRILDLMNRGYTREWYMNKIARIREIIPECGITCDIITGFCSETEAEHQDTLSLMEWAQFEFSYMYFYSERPGTLAARKLEDDIPEEIKRRRLSEVIALQNRISKEKNQQRIGKTHLVLIEGSSKKSKDDWMGKNDENIVVVFPKGDFKKGDYVEVFAERATTTSLIGKGLRKVNIG
jgi:tRNA-2-methylthio-N6-dimethylallyladenosine synthase